MRARLGPEFLGGEPLQFWLPLSPQSQSDAGCGCCAVPEAARAEARIVAARGEGGSSGFPTSLQTGRSGLGLPMQLHADADAVSHASAVWHHRGFRSLGGGLAHCSDVGRRASAASQIARDRAYMLSVRTAPDTFDSEVSREHRVQRDSTRRTPARRISREREDRRRVSGCRLGRALATVGGKGGGASLLTVGPDTLDRARPAAAKRDVPVATP
jgi:hypothetical protein